MNEENQAGIGLANASKMSRRGFLKTAALPGAAVAAGEALTACSAGPSAIYDTNEEVFVGVCRGNCFGGCPMDVHVRDGRLVRTSAHKMPEDQWTRICSKGLTSVYRTYSKERIKYPMKRAGERGGDQWERISWDDAIKEITDKIKQVQAEDGPESFAMFFGGSGNYACASGTNMPCYAERFMYATYSTPIVNDMDKGMVPIYPHLMMNGYYAPNTVWSEDWDKTNTFIFWGANPLQSIIQTSGFVMNAKEKGVKLICVDPQFSVTASKCDMHVPVRPGSDTLLAMAMMRIILENGWEDVDYLKNYTTAAWLMHADEMTFVHCSELGMQVEDDPYVVFDSATSTFVPVNTAQDPLHISDGTLEANGVKMRTSFDIILEDLNKYSLAEYAEMTNLPEETIFEFADIYANNGPATILTLMGFNHYGNSAYAFTAVNMLPAICGHYNKPYAGMASYGNSGYVDMALSWPSTRPGGPVAMNAFHPLDGSIIPFSKFYELLSKKQWNGKPINVRMLLNNCCDFLSNFADRNQNLKLIDMLETFVVIDPFMTDTARYADYVLPASFWYEQDDAYLAYFQSSPYAYFNEKAIEPLYESKPDFDIFNLLLDAMGLSEIKVETAREWIAMGVDNEQNRAIGVTPERFFEEKVIRNYYPSREFIDPKPMGPMTWVAEPQVFTPKWYDGQELETHDLQKLSWVEPHEAWPTNPLHEKYPFSANSHRGRYRTHTQWWDVEVLQELEPEAYIRINPEDAKAYGIEDEDYMRVYNDRGSFTAKAHYHTGVQPGTLYMPRGWQESQIKDGHHSSLSHSYLDPWLINECFFDVLVAIEKA